jgi:hypothetical protein
MTLVDLRESMSPSEFYGWIAYIAEKNRREKKAIMKAKNNIEDDE